MSIRKGIFELDTLAGNTISLPYPSEDDDDEGTAAFDRLSRALNDELLQRRASIKRGELSVQEWLAIVAYRALAPILDAELTGLFDQRIRQHSRHSRGANNKLNPFQYGLMALFAHDREALSGRDRERIAKKLWYAYRHLVPDVFLLGFLKQVRSVGLAIRAEAGDIEDGFGDWIAKELADPRSDGHAVRGAYSRNIMAEVNRIVRSRERNEERQAAELMRIAGSGKATRTEPSWD